MDVADFTGGPGLLAFIATFTMVVGAILLFRSLGKHLRKVRTHPPQGEAPAVSGAADPAGASAAPEGVVADEADDQDETGDSGTSARG